MVTPANKKSLWDAVLQLRNAVVEVSNKVHENVHTMERYYKDYWDPYYKNLVRHKRRGTPYFSMPHHREINKERKALELRRSEIQSPFCPVINMLEEMLDLIKKV